MMRETDAGCRDAPLETLLYGDETSPAYRRAAGHVEVCRLCQERLEQMAADRDSWSEVREFLGSSPEQPSAAQALGSQALGSRALGGQEPAPSPPAAPAEDDLSGADDLQTADAAGWAADRRSRDADLAYLRKEVKPWLQPPQHPELLGRLGRYEIEEVIGAGGMGIVLRGHDSELRRPVAIKLLAPHLSHRGVARQRFAREGRAAAAVMHEHVVAIHNVETEARAPYLVMQYVPGASLQSRVDERGALEPHEVLRIGLQAASGLAAAHAQGLVHRDVKPGNILLENGVERALLTDFGLARVVDDATLTHSGVVAGTPHYMAPEQADGAPVDPRSDLFSLGAVLYFAATGEPPFRGERPMSVLRKIIDEPHRPVWELNPAVPESLCRLIDRLLQKDPARRFQTAEQASAALAVTLARLQDPRATRLRFGERFLKWRTRWRASGPRVLWGATVIGLAMCATAAGWLLRGRADPSATNPPVGQASPAAENAGTAAGSQSPPQATNSRRSSARSSAAAGAEFDRELARLRSAVSDAQRDSTFVHSGNDPWRAAATAVEQDLSQLESQMRWQPVRKLP